MEGAPPIRCSYWISGACYMEGIVLNYSVFIKVSTGLGQSSL